MRTEYNAVVDGSFTSLPFGDGYAVASGEDIDPRHFAMLDQDVNDNDHAMHREYSSMTGRWMSPDPYSGSYNLANPQSFNRYSYVINSPMSYVDPLGLATGQSNCIDGENYIDQYGNLYTCSGGILIPSGGGTTVVVNGGGDGSTTGDSGDPYPNPGGPSTGVEYPYAGNGGRGGVGVTAPNNGNQPNPIVSKVTKFVCKGSPADRVLASIKQGAIVGAIRGGASGFIGGEIAEPLGGGIPGVLLGGFLGGGWPAQAVFACVGNKTTIRIDEGRWPLTMLSPLSRVTCSSALGRSYLPLKRRLSGAPSSEGGPRAYGGVGGGVGGGAGASAPHKNNRCVFA